MAYVYREGDPKACCDRCGLDYRLSQLRKEWTGLKVCPPCFDRRHPQEFVRGVPDRQTVPGARPEPAPVFSLFELLLLETGDLILLEESDPNGVTPGAVALEP